MKDYIFKFVERLRKKLPGWMNFQNLIFFIVILAFIIIVIWSEPLSHFFEEKQSADMVITACPTILPGTPTPLSEEWVRSAEQTNGVQLFFVISV